MRHRFGMRHGKASDFRVNEIVQPERAGLVTCLGGDNAKAVKFIRRQRVSLCFGQRKLDEEPPTVSVICPQALAPPVGM